MGVTGTNGKTTCATLLHKLLRELGYHAGLLSTVQNQIDEEVIPATHTTPDAIRLNALLARMVAAGCTHAFMEVSSHAVAQHRTTGLRFAGGMFTNLTHDHLDYHGTFDNYLKAKKGFFDALPKTAFALTNADDKRGPVMLQNTAARRETYSLRGAGHVPRPADRQRSARPAPGNGRPRGAVPPDRRVQRLQPAGRVRRGRAAGRGPHRGAHHALGPDHGARPLRAGGVGQAAHHRHRGLRPHARRAGKRAAHHCTKSASPASASSRWWAAAATATRPSAPSWPTWPPASPTGSF